MADETTPTETTETAGTYQLIGFVIVGKELKATVKTPGGDVFQGVVTNWQKVTAIEVVK